MDISKWSIKNVYFVGLHIYSVWFVAMTKGTKEEDVHLTDLVENVSVVR